TKRKRTATTMPRAPDAKNPERIAALRASGTALLYSVHGSTGISKDLVQGGTRLHDRRHLFRRRMVVTTDIRGMTLDNAHLFQDRVLVGFQLAGQLAKERFQLLVLVLGGQRLGPVTGEVEVAAAVIQL